MRLDEWAKDVTSQFGQDGIVAHIFERIGERSRVCVEFGASDGIDCSNTAVLRAAGWRGVLIEADASRYEQLERNAPNDVTIHAQLTPTGSSSIDALLSVHDITAVDFMSVDIDGDDYWIFDAMTTRPRVVCIEYNFTVPPHLHLVQPPGAAGFGASIGALITLGVRKGYTFVGLTHSDAFFVLTDEAEPFLDYERSPATLLAPEQFTSVDTDYHGCAGAAGARPPWGIGDHLVGIAGVEAIGTNPQRFVEGYERRYHCPVLYLTADNWFNIGDTSHRTALDALERYLDAKVPAVCLDLRMVSDQDDVEMELRALAAAFGYVVFRLGNMVALVLQHVVDHGHI